MLSRFTQSVRADPASQTARPAALRAGRMQGHGQRIGGTQRTQPVRPFHQHDAVARFLPAEFRQPARTIQPPEVEVMHRPDPRVVTLHQGEGRAWHFQRRIAARRSQERAGEDALAGAEFALQQDRIALSCQRRNRGRESFRGREVRQLDQRGRGGGRHGNNLPERRSRGQQRGPLRQRSMTGDIEPDVAIIGAGPVGLFAVFELGMLKLSSVLIDALAEVGGQCAALYPEKPIYDIPAHPAIDAGELVAKLERQIAPFQAPRLLGRRVIGLAGEPGAFVLATDQGDVVRARPC